MGTQMSQASKKTAVALDLAVPVRSLL